MDLFFSKVYNSASLYGLIKSSVSNKKFVLRRVKLNNLQMLKEVMVVLKVHLVIKEQQGTEKFGCKVFHLSFHSERQCGKEDWYGICHLRKSSFGGIEVLRYTGC